MSVCLSEGYALPSVFLISGGVCTQTGCLGRPNVSCSEVSSPQVSSLKSIATCMPYIPLMESEVRRIVNFFLLSKVEIPITKTQTLDIRKSVVNTT